MRHTIAFAAAFALALAPTLVGCTIRDECIDYVTTSTTSELGIAWIERCGIGHCMTIRSFAAPRLTFRLPAEPGTTTLEELEAELCTEEAGFKKCTPVTGAIVVRAVHPPAVGQPVGRLDADLESTSLQGGKGSVDYREELTPVCHAVKWPEIKTGSYPGGPGR
jgi:hypothetical protein